MCDVEYGVVWNVVSWYVECCIMQNQCGKLRCDEKWERWCGSVVMKNVAYAMCCDCCVMSDAENDAMCCQMWWSDVNSTEMWWCNAMWNMLWCEVCCDVECGCGVE